MVNRKDLTFNIKNEEQNVCFDLHIIADEEGFGMDNCSGCFLQVNKPKEINLISERVNQGLEYNKKYCSPCGKRMLEQLNQSDFDIDNKQSVLGSLHQVLETVEDLSTDSPEEEPKPQTTTKPTKTNKTYCFNSDCGTEITSDNKAGSMDCERCRGESEKKIASGDWIRTSRGGWIKKTIPLTEQKDPSDYMISELDQLKEKIKIEEKNRNESSTEPIKHFSIPLRKVNTKTTEGKIIDERIKEQLSDEEELNSSIEEKLKTNLESQVSIIVKKTDKETKVSSFLKPDDQWSLLTEEELKTLNSKQKWNLREKRKRALAKQQKQSLTAPKVVVDSSGTKETEIKNVDVDKASLERTSTSDKLKAFVHWAGGKKQHLETIKALIPKNYNRLIEPFVGGGIVSLSLRKDKVLINDLNQELMTTWQVIKDRPRDLISLLQKYQPQHSEEFYNQLKEQQPQNEIETAGRFIYLNKGCFNGLYRVNGQGKFNVGFNKKDKINIDYDNLLSISEYLNQSQVEINNQNYQTLLPLIQKEDFLFVDPPYDGQFNNYTSEGKFDQEKLFVFLKLCESKGAFWLLTNNNSENIRNLYQDYNFKIVKANSAINSNGQERKDNREEIFIYNYTLPSEIKKEFIKPIIETTDETFQEFVERRACFHLKDKFWQFFNKKNLPHIEKNTYWFFYLNIIKKNEKCLCNCLNDIRQARTEGETNGKNYRQMCSDLKKTKELDYKMHRQELLKLAKENRETKELLRKTVNENNKILQLLLSIKNKSKKEWEVISKLAIEHKANQVLVDKKKRIN